MGSLGEDQDLEKLVIDYIESPIIVSDEEKPSKILITLQDVLGTKGEKEKEIEEKIKSFIRRNKLSYKRDDEKKDVMEKIVSKLRSDGYDASISRTSWDSSFDRLEGCRVFRCTRKYEYIDVMVATDHDGADLSKRVIIDLDFKSQFELVKQTRCYKDLTEMLPTIFVATEVRLKRVVSLVCNEMKNSMKEEGMSRPPWRTKKYMQAKWLPENRRRVVSGSKKGSWSMFDDAQGGEDVATTSTGGGTGFKTKCCFPIF
ncbi:hypothetical protein N665_0130s0088 [Sinapis alba]|nr:hypothetical protein N665_0130s0088 [Sinapis alba]